MRAKKGDAKHIVNAHEYIICYARDKARAVADGPWRRKKEGADEVLAQYSKLRAELGDHVKIREGMMEWYRSLSDTDARKNHKHYNWSDDRGLYFAADFAGPDDGRTSRPRHDILHPVTGRPCKKPSTGWRWDEDTTRWALEQSPPRIHFGPDDTTIPCRKSYLEEISSEPFVSVLYRDGRAATLEVENLVGKGVFPFPKNTDVLQELVELLTKDDDIVLDFFAGSGSTGHAVMNTNSVHGSHRRFILVQLPEPTRSQKANGEWQETPASKAGYRTISEITRKRLTEAGKLISASRPKTAVDLGFRAFQLSSSNIRAWDPRRDDIAGSLDASVEHLKADRSEQDILFELLLKLGLELTVPTEEKKIAGKTIYNIGAGTLMACLDTKISTKEVEKLAHGIADWHKELAPAGETVVVFRDSAFSDDVAKTNLTAILAQAREDRPMIVRSL